MGIFDECVLRHDKIKNDILADANEIKSDVKQILRILNGNGGIGLCAKVNFLWGSFIFLVSTVVIQAIILTRMLLA